MVLQQLQGTLDFEHGGGAARQFEQFYNLVRAKLLEAQMTKLARPDAAANSFHVGGARLLDTGQRLLQPHPHADTPRRRRQPGREREVRKANGTRRERRKSGVAAPGQCPLSAVLRAFLRRSGDWDRAKRLLRYFNWSAPCNRLARCSMGDCRASTDQAIRQELARYRENLLRLRNELARMQESAVGCRIRLDGRLKHLHAAQAWCAASRGAS